MKRSLFVILLALCATAGLLRAVVEAPQGLRAQYIADAAVGGGTTSLVDSTPSTDAVTRAWRGSPPERFRAEWSGYLVVGQAGTYTFATTSDDGSVVVIDGDRVVDNSGEHGLVTRSGSMRLARGSHLVLVSFTQAGGLYALEWSWAREQSSLAAVPSWALWTKRTSYARALAARVLDPLLFVLLVTTAAVGLRQAWQARGPETIAATRRWWSAGAGRRAAARRQWRSTLLRRVLPPIVSLAFALLLAEGVARLIFRTVRSSGDARTFFATRATEPDPLNNFGYRDIAVPAKSARYRIIVIGDSITWGVGLSEAERYSNLLRSRLGDGYEVFNFGIPGHNMPEHLDTLAPALSASPDFILLQLYTNDFETPDMVRPRGRPLLPWPRVDAWLLRSSAVYTMLAAEWPRIQEVVGITETYEHYMYRYLGDPQSQQSREGFGMLHQFIRRSRDAGVPVGTVMFPNPGVLGKNYAFDYIHDRVHGVCVDEHIRCVDLRQPFLTHFTDLKDIVVSPFDGHPSAKASVVAADAILAEFQEVWRQKN